MLSSMEIIDKPVNSKVNDGPTIASWNFVENLNEKDKKEHIVDLASQKMEIIFWDTIVLKSKSSMSIINKLSSVASSMYFNTLSGTLFTNNNNEIPIFFNEQLNNSFTFELQKEQIMNTILYMSYRQNFSNKLIQTSILNRKCTDDSGWGCMIRSCQMLLSKALIESKIADYLKEHPKEKTIPISNLQKIREDVLLMFYDNYVPLNKIEDKEEFAFYKKKLEECTNDSKYKKPLGVFGPYSIQVLCQTSNSTGNFTSDITVIKSILMINDYFFQGHKQPVYVYTEGGNLKIQMILDSFCKPYINKAKIIQHKDGIDNMNKYFESKNKQDVFEYDNKEYVFTKKGVLFISLRLGLSEMDDCYIPCLKAVFKEIKNNIGFVCGKGHYAYYFIGIIGDKLLYLDPHFCQQAVDPAVDNGMTYVVKYIYMIDIHNISSQMTIGFTFNKGQDILDFINVIRNPKLFPKDKNTFLTIE